jgi:alkylhydroperoxidase family enzyme
MARLQYKTADEASAPVSEAMAGIPSLNIVGLLAHAEGQFVPWMQLSNSLINASELDPELREVAILRVASLSPGAEYEWVQHEQIAREIGLSEDRIRAIRSGNCAKPHDQLICDFTEQVVTALSPTPDTWGAITDLLSARQIVELMIVIGHYMSLARIMATAQIDPDPPVTSALYGSLTSFQTDRGGGAAS